LQRIQEGVLKFRNRIFPSHRKTFEKLAAHQNPDTLFITCADSRIVPNLFTHTGPGDMFVERNPGNIVPAYNNDSAGELASIEYAVAILKVRNVIVCGTLRLRRHAGTAASGEGRALSGRRAVARAS
jgi:carbonic anhydrase